MPGERWPESRHGGRAEDRWIVSAPSSTFFVRFSSVLERSGGEDRGGPGQHPFLLQPPIVVSRSIRLYPSIRPAPPSSSPPLSIRLSKLWTANTPGGSTHLRPNERPTEPTYPFCLPTYPSTYLSPLIHSLLSASGIPNW